MNKRLYFRFPKALGPRMGELNDQQFQILLVLLAWLPVKSWTTKPLGLCGIASTIYGKYTKAQYRRVMYHLNNIQNPPWIVLPQKALGTQLDWKKEYQFTDPIGEYWVLPQEIVKWWGNCAKLWIINDKMKEVTSKTQRCQLLKIRRSNLDTVEMILNTHNKTMEESWT